jgi:hypothetical protein
MPRIYLDMCCLSRKHDDQNQLRIRCESEAVRLILEAVSTNKLDLITSEILEYEIDRDSDELRRTDAKHVLRMFCDNRRNDSARAHVLCDSKTSS